MRLPACGSLQRLSPCDARSVECPVRGRPCDYGDVKGDDGVEDDRAYERDTEHRSDKVWQRRYTASTRASSDASDAQLRLVSCATSASELSEATQDGASVDPAPDSTASCAVAGVPTAGPNAATDACATRRFALVAALARILTQLAVLGSGNPAPLTRFHCARVPPVSLRDYLVRIDTHFHCSEESLILGLVYIDRIIQLHPEFTVSTLSIHRLLLTSVVAAVKFHEDVFYANTYYAKVGGIKASEMNTLESEFFRLLRWELFVVPQDFDMYRKQVLSAVPGEAKNFA